MEQGRCTAIVLAAGQGKRMHSKIQKQFLEIGGKPVLYYSLHCFQESPLIHGLYSGNGRKGHRICPAGNRREIWLFQGTQGDSRRKRAL